MGEIFSQGNIKFCACRRYKADFYNNINAGIGTSALLTSLLLKKFKKEIWAQNL